jgi:hypothetical protein
VSVPIPVVDEDRNHIGHIISRSPTGVEAFDVADASLGFFQDEREAAAEIWRHRRQQQKVLKARCHRDGASQTQRATRGACP